MSKWPVVGHEWAIDLLERAIVGNRLSHAYLVSGPAQVGKRTLAQAFAQALLCAEGLRRPCGHCRACHLVSQGHHPDVQIIAAEKNNIQIDQVRTLQSDAALSPMEGQRKIFIVREIEKATMPAANALLKSLEEPPPHVILILTCVRHHQLLPTIRSRCQSLALRPLPEEAVRQALSERWDVPAERAALLARLCGGRLGWAVSAHMDPALWQERARRLDDLTRLVDASYHVRLAYTDALSREATGISRALALWISWWRDLLLVQQGVPAAVVNLDRQAELGQQAERYRAEQLQAAISDAMQTMRRINANVNARLALDVWAMRLPRPSN